MGKKNELIYGLDELREQHGWYGVRFGTTRPKSTWFGSLKMLVVVTILWWIDFAITVVKHAPEVVQDHSFARACGTLLAVLLMFGAMVVRFAWTVVHDDAIETRSGDELDVVVEAFGVERYVETDASLRARYRLEAEPVDAFRGDDEESKP